MSHARWSTLLLAALVILGAGEPLSGQAPPADLIDAINKRDESRAVLLLKQGADPNVRDAVTQPAVTAAAYFGLETTVRALVVSGADLRALDNDGAGPLHAAAYKGHHTKCTAASTAVLAERLLRVISYTPSGAPKAK